LRRDDHAAAGLRQRLPAGTGCHVRLGERLGHRSPEVVNPGALASVVLAHVVDDVDTPAGEQERRAHSLGLGRGEPDGVVGPWRPRRKLGDGLLMHRIQFPSRRRRAEDNDGPTMPDQVERHHRRVATPFRREPWAATSHGTISPEPPRSIHECRAAADLGDSLCAREQLAVPACTG
jgi:hypothetical protein